MATPPYTSGSLILVFCRLIGATSGPPHQTGGVVVPIKAAILTIYFITIYAAAAGGPEWALNNPDRLST